ncbi:MAG: tRNA dihydrouridine synthase DusB [Treponema sp.]|jgi:nifR3 family TIM-barrel protein|nr:tRNA dihydrouridine synthase DusB [Treponema sp.]
MSDCSALAKKTETPGFYRPLRMGGLSLEGNLFLAPVAGYTDRAFRSVCVERGADFSFTELVSAESIIRNRPDRRAPDDPGPLSLLLRRVDGAPYGIQLFGAEPERMGQAAALLGPWRPEAVDINAGCPVPKVVRAGAGAALMRDPANLGRVVEAVVRASREYLGGVPVTVKIRSGWDGQSLNYLACGRIAVEAGAAMVTLHPRTRAQGYGGTSDWTQIADLADRLSAPVAGSGDLYRPEDAERMFRETGCAAVMFARGALGNPFIFMETRALLLGGARTPPGPGERMALAMVHLDRLAADLGERRACVEMRKHFCAYTKAIRQPGAAESADPANQARRNAAGLRGGAALRNRLVHGETIADFRRILEEAGLAGWQARGTG